MSGNFNRHDNNMSGNFNRHDNNISGNFNRHDNNTIIGNLIMRPAVATLVTTVTMYVGNW
jgi:hypothetical protein